MIVSRFCFYFFGIGEAKVEIKRKKRWLKNRETLPMKQAPGILSCLTPKSFIVVPVKLLLDYGCSSHISVIRDHGFCKDLMPKSGCQGASSGFISLLHGNVENPVLKASHCCFQVIRVSYESTLEQVGARTVLVEPSPVEVRLLVLVQKTVLVP